MPKKKTTLLIISVALLAVSGGIVVSRLNQRQVDNGMIQENVLEQKYEKVSAGSGSGDFLYPANLNDEKYMLGRSHNVFVAKIIKEIGNNPTSKDSEYIQYEAEVIYNIKGNLQGKVIVQRTPKYLEEGDMLGMPKPGNTYLMLTRNFYQEPWYTIPGSSVSLYLISKNNTLSNEQLEKIARGHSMVRRFQSAYKEEVVPEGAIEKGTDYNSYQSLTAEQKTALESYWRGDIESLDEVISQPARQ